MLAYADQPSYEEDRFFAIQHPKVLWLRFAYRSGACGSSSDLRGWFGSRARAAMSCCVMRNVQAMRSGLGDRYQTIVVISDSACRWAACLSR